MTRRRLTNLKQQPLVRNKADKHKRSNRNKPNYCRYKSSKELLPQVMPPSKTLLSLQTTKHTYRTRYQPEWYGCQEGGGAKKAGVKKTKNGTGAKRCQEGGGAKKAGVPRRRGCQEGGGPRGARPSPSRSHACQKTNRTNGSRDAVIQPQTSDPPCTHLLPTPPPYTTHTPQLPTNQPSSPPSQTPIDSKYTKSHNHHVTPCQCGHRE